MFDSPPADSSPGEEDEDNYEDANASVLYARLTLVEEAETGGQTDFDVFGGENKIGRDPDECNIVIHNKVTNTAAPFDVSPPLEESIVGLFKKIQF